MTVGPLSVSYLAAADAQAHDPPRVAFAIGKRVGPAVTRNTVRRRLREVMRLLAGPDGPVTAGTYLISVRPEVVALSFEELRSIVTTAVERVGEQRS